MLSVVENLGRDERVASATVSLAALMLTWRTRGVLGRGAWLAIAGYFGVRAATGHCALYDWLDVASVGGRLPRRRDDLVARFDDQSLDIVDHASELSFPCSDPPAH